MAVESHDEKPEMPEVRLRPVLLSALGALLLVGFAIGMLMAVYYAQVSVQSFPAPEDFPQPRVQTGQREQLHRLEAEQRTRLSGYHWVDRNQGLVQVPIERAMQILAAEGMQAYAPLAPPQALSSPTAGAERLITPREIPPNAASTGPAGLSPGGASAPASQQLAPSAAAPGANPAKSGSGNTAPAATPDSSATSAPGNKP